MLDKILENREKYGKNREKFAVNRQKCWQKFKKIGKNFFGISPHVERLSMLVWAKTNCGC